MGPKEEIMKNWILGLVVALGFLLMAPAVTVQAGSDSGSGRGGGRGFAAPELDPMAAGGAMVLVLGGVAYLSSRRRGDDAP